MIILDADGAELSSGDRVVFVPTHYKELEFGTVMYLTPLGVRVMPDRESAYEINRRSYQVIKVGDNDLA